LVNASVPVLNRLRRVAAAGGAVHYVVGNHDIVLEHFLDNVLTIQLSPFLNVRSGDRLVRIEHGHLYDPFFARFPRTYGAATKAAGLGLRLNSDVYRGWTWAAMRVERLRRSRAGDDVLGSSYSRAAAEMLLQRGFDAVVFGHTHNAELVQLPSGTYVNTGNWLRGSTYVELDRGAVTLRTWEPVEEDVAEQPRPLGVVPDAPTRRAGGLQWQR
jgi:UDP-2,3-diacylglucosamine pyrophosphatase LpxH